jgi:hypothetical protein
MRIFLPLVVGAVQMIERSLPQSQHPFHHFLNFFPTIQKTLPIMLHGEL